MNVELAMKAVEAAKAHPEHFNMDTFFGGLTRDGFTKTAADATAPPCGTTGCFAGFASLIAAPVGTRIVATDEGSKIIEPDQDERTAAHTEEYAVRVLDITREQAGLLFYLENVEQVELAVRYLADSPDAGYDDLADVSFGK